MTPVRLSKFRAAVKRQASLPRSSSTFQEWDHDPERSSSVVHPSRRLLRPNIPAYLRVSRSRARRRSAATPEFPVLAVRSGRSDVASSSTRLRTLKHDRCNNGGTGPRARSPGNVSCRVDGRGGREHPTNCPGKTWYSLVRRLGRNLESRDSAELSHGLAPRTVYMYSLVFLLLRLLNLHCAGREGDFRCRRPLRPSHEVPAQAVRLREITPTYRRLDLRRRHIQSFGLGARISAFVLKNSGSEARRACTIPYSTKRLRYRVCAARQTRSGVRAA
ncbi:hypothetical protein L226DRAFT_256327 [Lentinus tigrinus ALCF2SS1-7]|uniref:uncharacterized protein n=1 Tax=Lentinus tigrinus ALCF2SS1-7 TaxID=1328758 RepID=UPI001166398D|nr:hypothetical protein L226DRAFT_256327 [Lentinus tigrinus ALCF2SS1-7]